MLIRILLLHPGQLLLWSVVLLGVRPREIDDVPPTLLCYEECSSSASDDTWSIEP
jgi:hypothetical protein